MISKFLDFIHAEFTDPAVKRGIIVVLSLIGIKYGLDQIHSEDLATAIWALVSVGLSRMPGKGQS